MDEPRSVFADVLARVDEFNQTRIKLTAEMADNSNLVKTLVRRGVQMRVNLEHV